MTRADARRVPRGLTREEFDEARQLAVPVVTLDRSDCDLAQFHHPDTFGALVLQGMVLRQLRVADQIGMRLLGPGDIVFLNDPAPPMLVAEASTIALRKSACWHPSIERFRGILNDGSPAVRLHCREADAAIPTGRGQDYTDHTRSTSLRGRSERASTA